MAKDSFIGWFLLVIWLIVGIVEILVLEICRGALAPLFLYDYVPYDDGGRIMSGGTLDHVNRRVGSRIN